MGEPVRRYADFEKRLSAAVAGAPTRSQASPLRRRVGRAIKDRRKTLGITQMELASLVGVRQPSVSAWECGRTLPASEVMPMVARVLDLNLGEFADPPRTEPISDPGRDQAE